MMCSPKELDYLPSPPVLNPKTLSDALPPCPLPSLSHCFESFVPLDNHHFQILNDLWHKVVCDLLHTYYGSFTFLLLPLCPFTSVIGPHNRTHQAVLFLNFSNAIYSFVILSLLLCVVKASTPTTPTVPHFLKQSSNALRIIILLIPLYGFTFIAPITAYLKLFTCLFLRPKDEFLQGIVPGLHMLDCVHACPYVSMYSRWPSTVLGKQDDIPLTSAR